MALMDPKERLIQIRKLADQYQAAEVLVEAREFDELYISASPALRSVDIRGARMVRFAEGMAVKAKMTRIRKGTLDLTGKNGPVFEPDTEPWSVKVEK